MAKQILVIGVDCAAQKNNVGLARAEYTPGAGARVTDVVCGKEVASLSETIHGWMGDSDACLLAMDAPLGWPQAMGDELARHRAGDGIVTTPNELFRRLTDRDIQERLKKTPLDVGADRIARTAHAALTLLASRRSGGVEERPAVATVLVARLPRRTFEQHLAGLVAAGRF